MVLRLFDACASLQNVLGVRRWSRLSIDALRHVITLFLLLGVDLNAVDRVLSFAFDVFESEIFRHYFVKEYYQN